MRNKIVTVVLALLLVLPSWLTAPNPATAQAATGITYFQYTNNGVVGPGCTQTVVWKFRPPVSGTYQVYRWWYDGVGRQFPAYPGAPSPWYAAWTAGNEVYVSHQITNDAAFLGGATSRYRLIIFHPNGPGNGHWSTEPTFTSSESEWVACNQPTPTPTPTPTPVAGCSPFSNINIHRARSDAPTIYTGQNTGTLGYEYNIFCGEGSVDRILVSSSNQILHGQPGARNDSIRKDFTYGGTVFNAIWHSVYVPCSASIGTASWIVRAYSDNETFVNVDEALVNIQPGPNCGPV